MKNLQNFLIRHDFYWRKLDLNFSKIKLDS
jgi:hypothetical protein